MGIRPPVVQNLQLHFRLGEHIDYSLFGVLPVAIDRDILIACAPRGDLVAPSSLAGQCDDRCDITSTAGAVVAENLQLKYPTQRFAPISEVTKTGKPDEHSKTWFLDIDTTVLRWESYIKAGYYVRTALSFTVSSHSNYCVIGRS